MLSHTKISPRFLPPRSPCTRYPHWEMPLVYCYTHSSAVELSLRPQHIHTLGAQTDDMPLIA